MNKNLRDGDLELLEIVEHDSIPKKFALIGTFKGSKQSHILARIGEGETDMRSHEEVEMLANCLARETISTYGVMARLKRNGS